MKNKKKAIIITATGLVLLLAVIVTAVMMKQSGQKTAREPDRSEQTATDPASGDDEKAADNDLPVVSMAAGDAKDGTADSSLTEGSSGENPTSVDDTNRNASEKRNPADKRTTKKDRKMPAADNDNKPSQAPSGQKDDTSWDNGKNDSDNQDTGSKDTESKDTGSKDSDSKASGSKDTDSKDTGSKDSDTIELPFVPAE